MSGVNKVILIGHIGKDPEVRSLGNGDKVASFSLATTESYKDRNSGERVEKTEWHNVVLWRNQADIAERYLKKGSKIYLEGKITTESYEDKDGNTRYTTKIVGYQITMLDSKNNYNSQTQQPVNQTQQPINQGHDDLPF